MSLAPVLLQSLKVNAAGWRPGSATRCALVLGLVLVGGSLLGHPSWGVAAAIGAFNAGLVSLSGVYRTRLRTMIQVCLVTFACALLGGLVGTSLPLAVLTLTLGCLLFTAYGEMVPAAATLTLQAIMTLLILSGLRLPPSAVPGTALLVLLGGAAQVLVLGVLWPLGKYQPEKRAVSLVFAALADFVQGWEQPAAKKGRAAPGGGPLPDQLSPSQLSPGRLFPDDAPFRDAVAALASVKPGTWRVSHSALRVLLEEAEGLRAALISLGLQPWVRAQNEQARLFRRVLVRVLTQLRQSVRQGESAAAGEPGRPPVSSGALRALRVAADRAAPRLLALHPGQPGGEVDGESSPLALALDLLERLSLPVVPAAQNPMAQTPAAQTPAAQNPTVQNPVAQTDAPPAPRLWQLRPSPSQWQHSLRLALAVGLSDLLVRLLALPHGYWLPLTVGLVLRADYLTTVTRGAARLLGTLAAVLLGLLVGLVHPSSQLDTLLVLAAAWLAYALLQVGYAPFSAAVSLYVIFSVSASGLSQGAVAEGRLVYTVLGGVLALVAFLLWPIWQAGTARERLRQVALRQQEYAAALLRFTQTEPPSEAALEEFRAAARTSRVAAEGAVMAAAVEPRWASRSDPFRDLAQANMARLSANAARLLALQLTVRSSPGHGADPATRRALEASQGVARQSEQELTEQAG
ncbi:FUSC family protein [Deinococcus altitudinis]|uniref:FUSC family protein n=1 Tax=Deinococcus altitudinis TaxID=468914 RepID=UPI0038912A32